MTKSVFHCDACKRNLVHDSDFTTGYGVQDGLKHCFACCGEFDKDDMAEMVPGDKVYLYLTMEKDDNGIGCEHVTNWPGTLKFMVLNSRQGKHNWGLNRYDVWFKDHAGGRWHGVTIGDMTQICHCRKLKHRFAWDWVEYY